MKILHRYIFKILVRNLLLCLLTSVSLFLIFDFFDRIDNIMAEGASLLLTVQYFIYKVPMMLSHMLPVSMMVATILTFGILSKNSEVIAMRASGITLLWIA
ncbi:MAG: hypothetical protein DCC75_13965 [Proteobacteria bacterium]|nr:MAG: hypothetical protein DCC75_13965 [Pseudomonadota bacterium]